MASNFSTRRCNTRSTGSNAPNCRRYGWRACAAQQIHAWYWRARCAGCGKPVITMARARAVPARPVLANVAVVGVAAAAPGSWGGFKKRRTAPGKGFHQYRAIQNADRYFWPVLIVIKRLPACATNAKKIPDQAPTPPGHQTVSQRIIRLIICLLDTPPTFK